MVSPALFLIDHVPEPLQGGPMVILPLMVSVLPLPSVPVAVITYSSGSESCFLAAVPVALVPLIGSVGVAVPPVLHVIALPEVLVMLAVVPMSLTALVPGVTEVPVTWMPVIKPHFAKTAAMAGGAGVVPPPEQSQCVNPRLAISNTVANTERLIFALLSGNSPERIGLGRLLASVRE